MLDKFLVLPGKFQEIPNKFLAVNREMRVGAASPFWTPKNFLLILKSTALPKEPGGVCLELEVRVQLSLGFALIFKCGYNTAMMTKIKTPTLVLFVFVCIFAAFFPGRSFLIHADAFIKVDETTDICFYPVFRSYLLNDQRLQWSGQETTFGVEAILAADIQKKFRWGDIKVVTEFFINQPFDKNILADESRKKYLRNFEIETFEVKQLYIRVTRGNFTFGLGKHESLFGRNYTLRLLNSFVDHPFIRNEAILNFETGFFLTYTPGIFTFDIAIVNGSENMDTNSMKCGIVRIGLKGKNWGLGVSAKAHDGIGSEWQKQYKNHAGIDFMLKTGGFRISSEVIYDQYGFHREYSIDEVFWGRSYYYRDIFYKHKTPITGVGGYIDLQYESSRWFLEINYGEYYPKEIGHPYHDDPIKRVIIKLRLQLASHFHVFGMGFFENQRQKEPLFSGASDYAYLLGLQYSL
ncbi:MAG: hypothetical protein JSV88_27755 [Candidatus Aminicenantes bacterium]|nr:MAG: hypothetical protein JSV88_27755 [Candidatus Aminicenantes bacterium]